jgi:hypothetical protein
MGLWREIHRVKPKRAVLLRVLLILLGLIQIGGWTLMLSGATGGWPPRLPGGGGIYTEAAKRMVRATEQPQPPRAKTPEGGVFWRSVENLFRIQREVTQAGERAAIAAVEIAVELSFRISALSTGLMMVLGSGWVRRRFQIWLVRRELRTTHQILGEMEQRLRHLESLPVNRHTATVRSR